MASEASTMKCLKQLSICLAILALTQCSLASAFGIPAFLEFGECANTKVQPNLDLNRYSGVWFAQEMVPNEYSQISQCSMTNYTWKGDMMTVVERGLSPENKKVRQNSIIRLNEDEDAKEGAMTVDAEGVPSAPYEIVATDYENYACVYSCMSFMGFRAAFSWVYTRKPNPDHSYVVLCRDILAEQGVDPNPLKPVKQGKDCPYMEKLDQILAHTEIVLASTKNTNVMPEVSNSVVVEKSKTPKKTEKTEPEAMEATYVEEAQSIADLEKELRDEEDHLLSAMEEERKLAEQERRRMEEEEKRAQEEVKKMEEERQQLEAERTRMEEQRTTMEEELRAEKEELKELRTAVRTEVKRNHRGSRHREGQVFAYSENSCSHLSYSLLTFMLSACLTVLVSHL